jgi:hypothetical protein
LTSSAKAATVATVVASATVDNNGLIIPILRKPGFGSRVPAMPSDFLCHELPMPRVLLGPGARRAFARQAFSFIAELSH